MTNIDDFDALERELLADRDVRCAFVENTLRQDIASAIDEARSKKGFTLRGLASEIGTSLSQVQRLLHRELGGSLTLRTICRAADALGLRVSIHVRPECAPHAKIVDFGSVAWNRAPEIPQQMRVGAAKCTIPRSRQSGWQSATKPAPPPAEVHEESIFEAAS